MAEKITKNFWTTPKCGITFVENVFRDLPASCSSKILLIRNPYSRMVSFYLNKILFKATAAHLYSGLDEICDQCNLHNNPRALQARWKTPFALGRNSTDIIHIDRFLYGHGCLKGGLDEYSFEDFISLLPPHHPNTFERHLHLQSKGISTKEFDLIVEQSEINSRMEEICNVVGVDLVCAKNAMEKAYINRMPKNSSINERVGHLKPHEMRAQRKIPSNWRWFYTDATAEMVYELYKDDFIKFGYERDSWK
jgi:hypothetical protein